VQAISIMMHLEHARVMILTMMEMKIYFFGRLMVLTLTTSVEAARPYFRKKKGIKNH
jgi:hypothetical protein